MKARSRSVSVKSRKFTHSQPTSKKRKFANNKQRREPKDENKSQKKSKHDDIEDKNEGFFTALEDEKKKVRTEKPPEDPYMDETPDEKRVRLAKMYLQQLSALEDEKEAEQNDNEDEEQQEEDMIDARLKEEAYSAKTGRSLKFKLVADRIMQFHIPDVQIHRGHRLEVTSVVVSDDERYVYSASRDCTIIKWDIQKNTKLLTIKGSPKKKSKKQKGAGTVSSEETGKTESTTEVGHSGGVLCLALSTDGTLLASGGTDKKIKVWDTNDFKLLETFLGHRDAISCLSFRKDSHTLYSGSYDRSLKIWDCDSHSYIETLYGHVAPLTNMDCLRRERCVTSSSDKTVRLWKIAEETQLVFSGHHMSVDAVAFLTDGGWVTGGQDGKMALFSMLKKKPFFNLLNAHGIVGSTPCWISALAAIPYGDIVASGSNTGYIKLWKNDGGKELIFLKNIPVEGWINSLKFSKTGKYLIIGTGRDHRMGRWNTIKNAKNGVCFVPLQ